MMLLEPLIAAIAAGICVPVLVVLYLLKLRRRPVRVSTTAFWELAAEDLQANVPLKWLRISLLFLLHLLIVLLICLALGRPVSRNAAAVGSRAFVVLDCSASMQALLDGEVAGGKTRMDVARQKLKAEAKRLTAAGASVGFVTFAAQARVAVTPTTRASVLEEAIDSARASDQPGNLAAVLALVRGSLQEADEKTRNGRMLVEIASDQIDAAGVGQDSNLDVRVIDVVGEAGALPDNIGISAIAAKREPMDPAVTKVFIRLTNSGSKPVVAPCVLELDGTVVERFTISVPAATSSTLGEASAARPVNLANGGVLKATVTRDDLLAVDNVASIVIASAAPPRILLVSPQAVVSEAGNEKPADWMLAEVLSQLKPMVVEKARLSTYTQYSASGELSRFDAIVFDRVMPSRPPPVASLSIGASIPEAGLELGELQDVQDRPIVWDRTHPTLRDSPLDTLFIARSHVLSEPKSREIKVLARSKMGPLMLAKVGGGPKRIVTGFELAESNWPLETSFPIFVSEAIAFLSAKEDAGASSISTGDPVRIEVDSAATSVKIEGPDVRDVPATGSGSGNRKMLVLEPLEHAGVYKVSGGNALPAVLAVSLINSSESDLRPRASGKDGDTALPSAGIGGGRELWPLCVLVALALLGIEWAVFGFQARR